MLKNYDQWVDIIANYSNIIEKDPLLMHVRSTLWTSDIVSSELMPEVVFKELSKIEKNLSSIFEKAFQYLESLDITKDYANGLIKMMESWDAEGSRKMAKEFASSEKFSDQTLRVIKGTRLKETFGISDDLEKLNLTLRALRFYLALTACYSDSRPQP